MESTLCPNCGRDRGCDRDIVESYKIPFICSECGNIKFPYRALNGIVFIWPKPIPATQGKIFIPEQSQSSFKSSKGVVLSTGKGCTRKGTGEFVECEVKVGDQVLYDRSIPWNVEVKSLDGVKHKVDQANMFDVNAVIL